MREIKFRFWDVESKQMKDVSVLYADGKAMCADDSWDWYKRERIVMQYTGLKDKNGKEIYEGDILKAPRGGIGIAEFHKSWGSFYYKTVTGKNEYGELVKMISSVPFWNDAPKFEIIGNIYDNHELLEGSK